MRIITILCLFLSFSSFAVDGYQDIKFGISHKDLVAKKKCSIVKDVASSEPNLDVYVCENFKMTPQKTITAGFYFVDGTLLRVALTVGNSSEDFLAYVQALSEKYKQPSMKPTAQELNLYDQGKSNIVDFAWDNNTVILRQYREESEEVTLIIYSSPSYESSLLKAKTKGMQDAL